MYRVVQERESVGFESGVVRAARVSIGASTADALAQERGQTGALRDALGLAVELAAELPSQRDRNPPGAP